MYNEISLNVLKIHTGVGKMWGANLSGFTMTDFLIIGAIFLSIVVAASMTSYTAKDFERDLNKEN